MLPSELLEQEGWIQGAYSYAGLCALGAVNKAFTGQAIRSRARSLPGWDKAVGWVTWNDTEGRTQQEVVATLHQREIELGLCVVEDPIPWAAQMKEVAHVA